MATIVLYHKVACKVTINLSPSFDNPAREQGGANSSNAGNVEYVSLKIGKTERGGGGSHDFFF
jgi:hypothetical protein